MFVGALTLAALSCIPIVSAEDSAYCSLQALNASGFDQLANATESLNGTSGEYILTELSQGNKAIFAPSDNALENVDPAIFSNESALTDLIAYHIVSGNFVNNTETYPNVTIGRTLLNDSDLVMLEGNQSQVLVWSKYENGTLFVMNQGSNISVVNTTFYNNSAILGIDTVLVPPPNMSTVLHNGSYDLTSLAGVLQSASIPNGPSLLDVLSSARGITVFAPNNAAIQAAQSSLAGISNNQTALRNLASNHIINGTSVYSTELLNGSYVSGAGQQYAYVANSTGSFISVGGSNQVKIVEPNVLTSNGVVHIINGVMFDTNSDPALASSAYASATAAAAAAVLTTQTDPVALTATSTTSASTSTTSTSESTSATTSTAASASSSSTSTSTSTPTSTPTSAAVVRGDINWKFRVLAGIVVGFGQFL